MVPGSIPCSVSAFPLEGADLKHPLETKRKNKRQTQIETDSYRTGWQLWEGESGVGRGEGLSKEEKKREKLMVLNNSVVTVGGGG